MAFAYLAIIPYYLYKKRDIEPVLILYLFIFANLIDAIHIGTLRSISHNLIGNFIFAAFWLLLFFKMNIIRKYYFPILIAALASHVIADLLFSSYQFFYPFDNIAYTIFGWNSPEHMIAGTILVLAFLAVFIISKDYSRLREFMHEEEHRYLREFRLNNLFNARYVTYYGFFAFRLFVIVQLGLFIFSNMAGLSNYVWYTWSFLMSFILSAIMFLTLTLKPKIT